MLSQLKEKNLMNNDPQPPTSTNSAQISEALLEQAQNTAAQALFQALPVNYYWVSKDGNILSINQNLLNELKLTDYAQVVDCHITKFVDKEIWESCQKVMKEGQWQKSEEERSLENGSKRYYMSIKSPTKDEAGNITGVVGISTEITAQKLREQAEKREAEAKAKIAEEQAKTAKAEAKVAETKAARERDIRESLMTLSSAMVHDLNNHIAIMRMSGQFMDEMVPDIIKGYQLAVAHGLMPKPGHRPNQLVHLKGQGDLLKRQARGLQDYVANNLATLRKAILDELSASDLRPLEIGKVIQHFLNDFPFAGEMTDWVERKLRINFTFQGNEILCYRILGNLTHNAIYQIKKNNNQGHISITTQEGEDANYLIFMDNAGGASQEVVDQMFDLNYTTKGEAGNGVGLAFCKKVMRMFGGDIWAQSKDGQMVFTLKFPKVVEENGAEDDALRLS
jgi:signal transduction histidine kinase